MPIKLTDTSGAVKIVTQDTSALKAQIAELTEQVDKAFTEGQQAERDAFWDIYQQNGERTVYNNAFSGYGWTDETFKPKYDMRPISATQMFHSTQITNLKQILDKCGVVLDFSNCTGFTYTFQQSKITHIGVIDTRKCGNLNYFMTEAKFVYIEKIILKDDGSQSFMSGYSFSVCRVLEHIIFEGVIGKNGLDLHWSTKLDADSLKSIIDCLSTTTTGLTVTLPATAQSNYDAVYGSGAWEELVATKSNWTIALL